MDFGALDKQSFASLAKDTTKIFTIGVPSPEFRTLIYSHLSAALLDAATRAREIATGGDLQHDRLLEIAADTLTETVQEYGSVSGTNSDQEITKDRIHELIERWNSGKKR